MTDIFVTPAITVGAALVIYGLTQFIQRASLDPGSEVSKALGRAASAMIYYGNVYASPGIVREELTLECSRELRKCASELRGTLRAVRCYPLCRAVHKLPRQVDIERLAKTLIGLSNVSRREDADAAWIEANYAKRVLGLT